MITSSRASATLIDSLAGKLGADLPEAYTSALTAARDLRDAASAITGSADAINARILTLLREGKDWHSDKQLTAAMLDRIASGNGIRQAGERESEDQILAAINEHADEILEAFADAIEADAEVLANAAEVLLDTDDLSDPDHVALRRSKQLNTWADAAAAAERIDQAVQAWKAIATACHVQRDPQREVLVFAEATSDQIVAARAMTFKGDPTPWTLARLGAPIRLATISGYMERTAALIAQQQERAREQELAETG
ncbi:hypothetical protein H7J77_17195 [Mycolicibacillus parakoreensis]|uniref:DUF222 domain-containing protein n=1 Tax=Mycolicibacillus parakoreensis TaxID=1069221 RepID=A0ABY3TV45_9MYCO|nr:hypothetical protein [Mycolicibacillus parakoreensis]MCV7317273.1 hypothetical protein [Mycolicibacillus parakoreensis]ULN51515.1 hypothetical protein MIU77_11415 [Mycolicibacillus parakoreensis]